ncbi:MAG: hypothetical protein U1A78_21330 [Polyangia bacterium]
MKLCKLLLAAGFLWALQGGSLLHERAWLGFPDGSLTELARVRRLLYPVLGALCAAAALTSWAMAYRAHRADRAGATPPARAVTWALPLFGALVFALARWALDHALAASLDDGGGG